MQEVFQNGYDGLELVMAAHLAQVRSLLEEKGLDAILIRSKAMKRWMGTMTGSGCSVVVSKTGGWLIVDGRYINEAREREHDLSIRLLPTQTGSAIYREVGNLATEEGWRNLGVESSATLASQHLMLEREVPQVTLLGDEIAELRICKTAEEMQKLQHAVDVTDAVFSDVVSKMHVGITDYEISALLQYGGIAGGSEKMSFDTIVSIGTHTADPHGRPKGDALHSGEHVMMDFGFEIGGFQSDMTRIVFCGTPSDSIMQLYKVVRNAQQAGIDAIGEGVNSEDVDAAARAVIETAGYGDCFTHGLGHGIGVDDETELPLLRPGCHYVLHEGMVMSCEPGVYVSGLGGIRIEDDVWLHDGHGMPLNHTTKDPIVIDGE